MKKETHTHSFREFVSVKGVGTVCGGFSRSIVLLIIFGFYGIAQNSAFDFAQNTILQPGDLVYVDSGDAFYGGFVIKVDPQTGEKEVIASGGLLNQPFGIALNSKGQLIISDTGRLIAIEPRTGVQTLIVDNTKGDLGQPCGIALQHKKILVANLRTLVSINPSSKQIQTVCEGGHLLYPVHAVPASRSEELIVLNIAFPAEILRVKSNGEQIVISRGGLLNHPQALGILKDSIFVTDGNFGTGRIIEIDARTGGQSIVTEGNYLSGPVGIAVDQDGKFLVVGDPYTVNVESDELFDGAIIKIDLQTHRQTLITRGEGPARNPRGILIVPTTADN